VLLAVGERDEADAASAELADELPEQPDLFERRVRRGDSRDCAVLCGGLQLFRDLRRGLARGSLFTVDA